MSTQQTLKASVDTYEAYLSQVTTENSVGISSQSDVLTAKNNLYSAKSDLESIKLQCQEMYDSICLMCGYPNDGSITIESDIDSEIIDLSTIDLQTDIESAIGNNSTLISYRHNNTSSTAASNAKEQLTGQDGEELKITIQSLYNTLVEVKSDYNNAKLSFEAAKTQKNINDAKASVGMFSAAESLSAQMNYISAQSSYLTAYLKLKQAEFNYSWSVEGTQ